MTPDAAGEDPIEWEPPIPFRDEARPAFPTNHLPRFLKDMVDAVAKSTQTAPEIAALAGLGVASAAIAGKFTLRLRPDRHETASLWTASIAGSGERKSAVFGLLTEPLNEWEREEMDARADSVERERSRARTLDIQLADAEREAASADRSEAQAAADQRDALAIEKARIRPREHFQLVLGDVTPETLVDVIAGQRGRAALISDEAATFFSILTGRYAKDGRSNLDSVLQAFSGSPIRVNRKGRAILVPRPALAIATTMQPRVLTDMAERPELIDRGVVPRFYWAMPESLVGMRDPDPPSVPDDVRALYRRIVRSMCDAPESLDAAGHIVAAELGLDGDAADLLRAFRVEIERELRPGGQFDHVREWGNRIEGNAARLALVLHLAAAAQAAADSEEPLSMQSAPVSLDPVASAIALAREFFIPHGLAVFARMGAGTATSDAQRLRDWIVRRNQPQFSRRDAHRGNQTWAVSADDLDEPLRILEERIFIRAVSESTSRRAGHPAGPRWIVNPFLINATARDAGDEPGRSPATELAE